MFSVEAIRNIIRISLQPITATRHPLYSPEAEEILLMIASHESGLGRHLHQIGGGPARGLLGVEPRTMRDNYANFIDSRAELARQIRMVSGVSRPDEEHLTYNPQYGVLMARLWLYRCPGTLPPVHDIQAMAEYAKANYNSAAGAATAGKYFTDYIQLIVAG